MPYFLKLEQYPCIEKKKKKTFFIKIYKRQITIFTSCFITNSGQPCTLHLPKSAARDKPRLKSNYFPLLQTSPFWLLSILHSVRVLVAPQLTTQPSSCRYPESRDELWTSSWSSITGQKPLEFRQDSTVYPVLCFLVSFGIGLQITRKLQKSWNFFSLSLW